MAGVAVVLWILFSATAVRGAVRAVQDLLYSQVLSVLQNKRILTQALSMRPLAAQKRILELELENRALIAETMRLKVVEEAHQQLQRQFASSSAIAAKRMPVRLIQLDEKATLLAGQQHGIFSGASVFKDGFYIGSVQTVYPTYAMVALLSKGHRTALVHEKSKQVGVTEYTNAKVLLRFFGIAGPIEVGDGLTTQGAGQVPAGLPAGRVKAILTARSDPFTIVEVEPGVPIQAVDTVLVEIGESL